MTDSTVCQPGFQPYLMDVVCTELLPHCPRPLCCKSTQVRLGILPQVQMWDSQNNVSHSKWMSKDSISDSGLQRPLCQHWRSQLVGTKGDESTHEMKWIKEEPLGTVFYILNALPVFQTILSEYWTKFGSLTPTREYRWQNVFLIHQMSLEDGTLHFLCQLCDTVYAITEIVWKPQLNSNQPLLIVMYANSFT